MKENAQQQKHIGGKLTLTHSSKKFQTETQVIPEESNVRLKKLKGKSFAYCALTHSMEKKIVPRARFGLNDIDYEMN